MSGRLLVSICVAALLLGACTSAPAVNARIVAFTASAERVPRGDPVTLVWQAADAGVQDGLFSCVLTRRFGDATAETTVAATCTGSLSEVPPAPLSAATVEYRLAILKQPFDPSNPYLTQTRPVVLDPAKYAIRAGGVDFDTARGIDTLPDGSALVVGEIVGSAAYGATALASAGATDVVVAKTNIDGTWAWATRAGGTGVDQPWSVSGLADGGALVAGSFALTATFGATSLDSAGGVDAFVAKIGPNGTWAWATRAGGAADATAWSVGTLDAGSAIVAGTFQGSATFGTETLDASGGGDAFVAKVHPDGSWAWAIRGGGTLNDSVLRVVALADGGALVAGFFGGSASFGTTSLESAGDADVFVARILPDGAWSWAVRAGGAGTDLPWGASPLPDGGALIAGEFRDTAAFGATVLESAGAADAFVARIRPDGTWAWAARAGGTDMDSGSGVVAWPDGSATVAGSFAGTATFGSTLLTSAGLSDVFVAKIDPAGTWTHATRGGGASTELVAGVGPLADGGAIVAGLFFGTSTFGTDTLGSAGLQDVFVARIGAEGDW